MSKARKLPDDLGFDIEADDEVDALPEIPVDVAMPAVKAPRQDDRPSCPAHECQMTAYATSAMYTYYRCPRHPKCRETAKRVRAVGPLKNKYGHGESKRS